MLWHRVILFSLCCLFLFRGQAQTNYHELDKAPHAYWTRPLKDRFTRLKADLESGKIPLDRSNEKAFLSSLLKAMDIPASSQTLVFSTTSLQLSLITPGNPRAIYFNEDLYVGYIPGGKIEIVSLDPEVGGIFYIFPIPRGPAPLAIERSTRCMNCHADEDTQFVPGLLIKSVMPGPAGGSLTAYRIGQTGHQIPFEERFGGWYVTGKHGITNHWGNLTGRLTPQGLIKYPVEPGKRFDYGKYLIPSSDILPHLLHEHQAGFVNRTLEASYRARVALAENKGKLTPVNKTELEKQANILARYILFADEAALPAGGVEGDAVYRSDFALNRRQAKDGSSLKDFDLKTRLFKYRCSYMIYSPVFEGLPPAFKQMVYERMKAALSTDKSDKEYAYLPQTEKQAIRNILLTTCKDLPKGW